MLDEKIELQGTHRARQPDVTWARIEPHLKEYGVTRVADVTDLDCIGIPVFLAVRPDSETLAVSQGKGVSSILAKLSAVLESIELWHAEHPRHATTTATAADLSLPYPLTSLGIRVDPALCARMSLDWYLGTGVLSQRTIPIPRDAVDLSFTDGNEWRPSIFPNSSRGLASGNTFEEAALHAIYEVIERDAISLLKSGEPDIRRFVDTRTVDSEFCQELFTKLRGADVKVEVVMVPNAYRLPVAAAFVWSEEYPIICSGSGAHSDPYVALSRAVTEAVQTRLTEITGTRDDIPSKLDVFEVVRETPAFEDSGETWESITEGLGFKERSLSKELQTIATRVAAKSGHEPICLDLSTRPDLFSVVKILCPGLEQLPRGFIPR